MKRKKVIALIIGVCAIAAVGTVVYVNTSDKTPSKKTETTTEKDNTNDKTDDILETFMQPDYATEYVSVPEYKSVEYQYDPVTTSDDDVTNQIRYNMMTYTMDKIPSIEDSIPENACVSFSIARADDPDNALENVESKMVSTFDSMETFKNDLMAHKVGDTFTTKYVYNGEEIDASIHVYLVTEDPINSFNDDWVAYYVKNYKDSDETIKNLKTTDDYREYVRKQLDSTNEESNTQNKYNALYSVILDKSEVKDFSEDDIQREMDEITGGYKIIEDYAGANIKESIMKDNNLANDDEYNAYIRNLAIGKMKTTMLNTIIANQEGFMPTSDKEWDEKIREYDENVNADYMISSSWGKDRVKDIILDEMVQKWLLENN